MTKAPWSRRIAATAVDMVVFGGLWWLLRSRGWVREGGAVARLTQSSGELVREQLRSPGQRLLGLATVDARTGRRLAPWRSLLPMGSRLVGQLLLGRLVRETPEAERRREAFGRELGELAQRQLPQAEREEARRALLARYSHVPNSFARAVVPTLAVGLVNSRLRRRIAPTVEVLARGRGPHSP